ncbi:hypothetical protein ACFL08_01325 [Patescibacteria group bacterium]
MIEIDSIEKAWVILSMKHGLVRTEPEIKAEVLSNFHVNLSMKMFKCIIDELETALVIKSLTTKSHKDLNIKAYYVVDYQDKNAARRYLRDRRVETS